MKHSLLSFISHLVALVVMLMFLLGVFVSCTPVRNVDSGLTSETQKDTSTEQTNPGAQYPDSTLPEDIRISFQIATTEEAQYIHTVHGNHFDASGNRFFDAEFYMIYRFPTHAKHKNTELIISLSNQYEISASADGVHYEIIASSLKQNQSREKLILDLSNFRPSEGDGYIYIRLGDSDTSDGWGGNLSGDIPVRYFSGMPAISTEATKTIQKGNNTMYLYDLTPGSATESEFILRNSSTYFDTGADPFRLCDAKGEIVYVFRGTPEQIAYVTIDLSHEYLIELSTDDKKYDEIVNFTEWGRYRDYRSIDLSDYFADSQTVYLRISDYEASDGWGPQIRGMYYTVLTNGAAKRASININDGWRISINGTAFDYTVGDIVDAKAGDKVVFEKTVTVPANYVTSRAISFAYIEGVAEHTTVTVDGKKVEQISGSANTMTLALPEGNGNEDSYTVRISTVAGESGKTGLWRNVRLGMADMIRYPETSRTLGDTTRNFCYAEAPYDQVKLNALAGNFLQSLYSTELGLNSVDTSMAIQDLYYVGDTARALIGVAYEEVYSPVVRLEYAMGMYKGLLNAMVPTSDTHCFLKYDIRPKRVIQKGNALVWYNTQDLIEPFADMYLLPDGCTYSDVTLSYTKTEEDRNYNGAAEATVEEDNSSVHAKINWYSGTSDRATVAALRADNCDRWSVMLRFDSYGTNMECVAVDGEIVVKQSAKQAVELEVSNAYFVFDRLNWNTNGIVFATDILPTSAYIIPSEDGSKYAALVLEFDADDRPNVTAVQLGGIDTNLEYAYYVIGNLTDNFRYGCNGYDPSFIVDYPLGALAAGAYLMKKYNIDGWEQAVERAATALKECDTAITERNYVPSVWQSAMAGCHFMVMMGENTVVYRDLAAKWADSIVADQKSDGSYTWLDSRNPVATLIAYDITENEKYLESARRWMEASKYTEEGVIYRNQLYDGPSFNGAGDMILMNRFGYNDPLAAVMALEGSNIDDSGFFACSDINPYYLGYSLADLMEFDYDPGQIKKIVSLDQYVMYGSDGSCTISDRPNVYVNNPFK